MYSLEHGTLIECDDFSAVVVTDSLLLVFDTSDDSYIKANDLLHLQSVGPNDWIVGSDNYGLERLIKRDWKGEISIDWLADPWFDDWQDDWYGDDIFFDFTQFDAWDDYRSLSSPAHIPRVRKALRGRYKLGGRRRQ